ncbi:hypothetical protein PIB30_063524 [Stylosanthes scabra]|uniref:Uncharacterized protein n=1 Tax=Stylosanthes scabra TaxID=79078 RepID=A0ABU6XM84_9FABA|nr:hypothetical protein [Stylosanthes scabra]
MVHLVNRSTGLDQSTPFNSGQPLVNAVNHRSAVVKGGQRFVFLFSFGMSQEVKRLYTDFANSDHRKFCGLIWCYSGGGDGDIVCDLILMRGAA